MEIPINKIWNPLIMGAHVLFAPAGAEDQANKIGPLVAPTKDSQAWEFLGKVASAKPQLEPKTVETKGYVKGVGYRTKETKIVSKNKYLISLEEISRRVIDLAHGLTPVGDGHYAPFSSNAQLEGWLYAELEDAYTGIPIATMLTYGTLSLNGDFTATDDPTKVELLHQIEASPLNEWTYAEGEE